MLYFSEEPSTAERLSQLAISFPEMYLSISCLEMQALGASMSHWGHLIFTGT